MLLFALDKCTDTNGIGTPVPWAEAQGRRAETLGSPLKCNTRFLSRRREARGWRRQAPRERAPLPAVGLASVFSGTSSAPGTTLFQTLHDSFAISQQLPIPLELFTRDPPNTFYFFTCLSLFLGHSGTEHRAHPGPPRPLQCALCGAARGGHTWRGNFDLAVFSQCLPCWSRPVPRRVPPPSPSTSSRAPSVNLVQPKRSLIPSAFRHGIPRPALTHRKKTNLHNPTPLLLRVDYFTHHLVRRLQSGRNQVRQSAPQRFVQHHFHVLS